MAELEGGVAVLTGYASMQQSGDMAAPFLQESNFLWLSGIDEPGWKIIIDAKSNRTTLVAPHRSDVSTLFDGGISVDSALKTSSANAVIGLDELEGFLRRLARDHSVVYDVFDQTPYEFTLNPAQRETHLLLERTFKSVVSCRRQLAQLRAIKQPEEIVSIRRAVGLTMAAFEDVKQSLAQSKYEYELEAIYSHTFKRVGADHAYAPIIASGENACTLHYARNDHRLRSGKMVLMDVGARVHGYAADITRTYAKGKPTKRHIAVHAAVERAHHRIISLIEPMLSVQVYQSEVDAIMTEALAEVGLPSDEVSLRKYFPHAVSHGLGVDVHDSLGSPKHFKAGMVLTVEPGIYIPEEGIGVRIEDDILVTATGRENLSTALSTGL